jgi:hypothetical protein
MNIKPIETWYNGYYFRSRLEARWAVFFDFMDIEYQYEVEGYEMDGIRYLPDFYLPKMDCFIEVKPFVEIGEWVNKEAFQKAILLSSGLHKQLFFLCGEPYVDCSNTKHGDGRIWEVSDAKYQGFAVFDGVLCDHMYYWCKCYDCGAVGLQYTGLAERNKHKDYCKNPPPYGVYHILNILAYCKARAARFGT